MPADRRATCIFCDDIRFELGHKTSLMGIYNGEIIFDNRPPFLFPRFGVAVLVISDVDDPIQNITTTVVVQPQNVEVFRTFVEPAAHPIGQIEDARSLLFQQMIPLAHIMLPEEGFIEVWIETEKGRLRAGRVKVSSAISPPAA